MKSSKASHTADFAAAIRATYQFRPEKKLHEDPYAIELTSPWFRFIVTHPFLRNRVMEKYFLDRLGSSLTILSRGRFAEEHFLKAYERGIKQIIILGAGLDAFAFKFSHLGSRINIFELDHPNTQNIKKNRMIARGLKSPHNHHFIPIDFTKETISDVLLHSKIDLSKPVYITWMGVTYYLPLEDISKTLKSLDKVLAPHSQMSFDYMDERLFDDNFLKANPLLEKNIRKFFKFTEEKGEPLLCGLSPETLTSLLKDSRWKLVENISGLENTKQYLTGPANFLWPTEYDHLAHIESQKV